MPSWLDPGLVWTVASGLLLAALEVGRRWGAHQAEVDHDAAQEERLRDRIAELEAAADDGQIVARLDHFRRELDRLERRVDALYDLHLRQDDALRYPHVRVDDE